MDMHRECFPEMIAFVRAHANEQERAFVERYCEVVKKDPYETEQRHEDSRRFTEIATRAGYFESEVFLRHLAKIQPLIRRLMDELERGEQ